jgi:hypothetical protein
VTALDAAPFLARFFFGVLAGGIVWWSATDLGRLALRALRVQRADDDPIAAALGYALVGCAVALLGLAHALSPLAFGVLLAAQFVTRWRLDRRFPIRVPQRLFARAKSFEPLDTAAAVVTGFAWLTASIAAALPASWWDPIAYHLPIAARALAQQTFAYDPGMVQTAFPLLGEAAAVPAFAFGGTAGAAFATLGCGIVLALICGEWAERIAAGSGRLAIALVSCSALWLWLAPSFYVDVPFAMFALGMLSLIVRKQAGEEAFGWAIAAGLLGGAAAATKYPGIAVGAIGLVAVLAATRREQRLRTGIDFAAAALALAGGWYTRTALSTGDPLFPFLSTQAAGQLGDFAARYVSMTRGWCGGGATFADAISLPWRLLTDPRAFCGDPGYALDLGVIFFIAALALFRRMAIIFVACAFFTAIWFFSSQQLRFLVPAVSLFAIASAVGATATSGRLKPLAHTALLALCFIGVMVDWLPGSARDASNSIAPGYAYVVGAQSGDDYLSSRLEFYGAVRWLKDHRDGSQIAALDDVRDYYFGSFTAWLNPFYQPARHLDWSLPSRARYRSLTSDGYRYLVVNENAAYVARTPTGVDQRALDADVGNGTLRSMYRSADGVAVYELPSRTDR